MRVARKVFLASSAMVGRNANITSSISKNKSVRTKLVREKTSAASSILREKQKRQRSGIIIFIPQKLMEGVWRKACQKCF